MQNLVELRCALDPVKLHAYENYIRENVEGKVVADFGAGPGILTWLCLKYGAKKVYAVDHNPGALEICHNICSKLGDVEIVEANLYNYIVPDDVELIIHEILGHLVFDELIVRIWRNLEKQNKLHLHMDMRFEFFDYAGLPEPVNRKFDSTLFSVYVVDYFREIVKIDDRALLDTSRSLESKTCHRYVESKPFFSYNINTQPIDEWYSQEVLDKFMFHKKIGWRCFIGNYSFDNTPRPYNNWYSLPSVDKPKLFTRIPIFFNEQNHKIYNVNPFEEDTCPFLK